MEHAQEQRQDDLAQMASQSAWARRLAIALARDVQTGEDLAQEALLASVRRPPSGDLRAWLARVIRNLARLRLRSAGRRSEREQRASRPDPTEDPVLALQRVELQEALLGAVRELADPYRTTVLLRWFEGLEPEQIAERTKTPVRTVHTRLHRALGLLRETLERRSKGDRSRWLAAWLPALSNSSSGWKWPLLMKLKTKLAIAGLAGVTLFSLWYLMGNPGSSKSRAPGEGVLASIADEPTRMDRAPLDASGADRGEREPAAGADAASTVPQAIPGARKIRGVVIDVAGAKLPGVELVFRPSEHKDGELDVRPTSDALGQFEFETSAPNGSLEPVSSDWALLYELGIELPDPPGGYVLVLGRPRTFQGLVLDPDGKPIAGAGVWFGPPGAGAEPQDLGGFPFWPGFGAMNDPLGKSLGLNFEAARVLHWTTRSLETGEFAIRGVDRVPGFILGASASGYENSEITVPEGGRSAMLVLQHSREAHEDKLYGMVLDPDGHGVAGACVRLGTQSARTDDNGSPWRHMPVPVPEHRGGFAITLDPRAPGARLIALHPDWQPVIQPCLTASPTDPGAWPKPLVLKFTEPAPGIRGVVVDEEGKPVAHAGVRALDPTSWNELLGTLGEPTVEGGDRSDGVLGDGSVETDDDGRFRLQGLSTRSYRLCATEKRTLALGITERVSAGAGDVRIVIRRGGSCPIEGRVVDPRDVPIEGASVWARRKLAGAGVGTNEWLDSDAVRTDASGRFSLPDLCCDSEELIVQSESAAPAKLVPIDRSAARDRLVIKAGRIARVRVEIQKQGLEANWAVFLDSRGERLKLGMKVGRGGWMGGGDTWDVRGGRTAVIIVSEEATTAVLMLGNKEVARLPIHLDPSDLNVVRP